MLALLQRRNVANPGGWPASLTIQLLGYGGGGGGGGGCVLYYETGMDYTVRNSRLEDMAQWLYRSACYAKEKTRVQIPGTHVKARCTVPEPVISAFLWGDTCREQENPSSSEAC